ncbi:pseudouridine-5'-phosphate glycosidase [Rhodococcus phenolicus]|uniref:pseudouridine-5'-phosphate glycosidase n=1 Tax=Rhodococcus phenolicus TaxID=263849 RepID=UPI0008358E13|nr:pseudouridine-5'-phosphate glycosidase [Rhodococcus phenolicus]
MKPLIHVSQHVRDAVAAGRPVVALESTIFTHGLTPPRNLEVAFEVERNLRDAGVVPATVGVVGGVPIVGLSAGEISALGSEAGVEKLGVRDLPVAAAKGLSGGTTVASTAVLAHHAGVRVFATGGLGGVHRGAATTFDESADLTTLAAVPILVVSAGVKSILDVPASLERLETLGVPVVGYRTRRFPGFYVRESGCAIDYSVESPVEVAAIADARDRLGTKCAVLLVNPVAEEDQLDPELHDRVLREAVQAAEAAGITGKATTPFLLDHLHRATGGRSLDVNVAVYRANVALGGAVAAELVSR